MKGRSKRGTGEDDRRSFLFAFMEKMPVFLDDGIYTPLRFHAHQATERGDEFWREKKRNGVRGK